MKIKFIIKSILIIAIISLVSMPPVNASPGNATNDTKVNAMVRLGIFKGDLDGNLRLEDKILRSELITAFIRTLGLESEIDSTDFNIAFKDIDSSHWAYNYIRTAVEKNLVSGYPDNTVGPDRYITYSEALTFLIRVLGYDYVLNNGKWPDNIMSKSNELGITEDFITKADKQMTRREVATLIYNSLMIELKY